ncbi:replication restart DNA helicase PriA [Frankia sp. EI5c]|uniref:primosomal protein N' n=1 Tax=Frankia sp. EI5c TaxID=683316 RepID=UPI0007C28EFC|nr:primosomal protein N' [Frankia sp. EI5c]OAA25924.1 replication restart DNA helicase PriA [Frankia sp. EI5c]
MDDPSAVIPGLDGGDGVGDGDGGDGAGGSPRPSRVRPRQAARSAAGPGSRGRPAGPAGARRARPAAARDPGAVVAADELPVARVVVDTPLVHLDRPFDYLVPAALAADVVAGSRVRVRFAGRLVDGIVLERCARSDHEGRLAPLARSVSPEPVLSPAIARLARAVADRYAGTMADVLRLAIPPRHARAEKAPVQPAVTTAPGSGGPGEPIPGDDTWSTCADGPAFLAALAGGASPRAIWWAPPGPAWPGMIASAVAATVAAGRGALVVVPDHRDADRVAAALEAVVPAAPGMPGMPSGSSAPLPPQPQQEPVAPVAPVPLVLRADLGPQERYRRFLAVRRGEARVVVGTRAAVFAPVADLGLLVVWDDGDDLHAEPRAPYPHTRDVAVLRAQQERCAVLIGGHSPSVEAEALVRVGWAGRLAATREAVRRLAPRVEPVGSDFEASIDPAARAARLPSLAVRSARAALGAGSPVLVQVPRRGYHPSISCARCRRPARCRSCSGPLGRVSATAALACRWCGRPVPRPDGPGAAPGRPGGRPGSGWRCRNCGGGELRAAVTGDRRTAEELGRAFPGVPVRTSGRDAVLATVPAEPALVIATPGAEPVASGGYGAVLLLDGWALLGRPDLRAGEETLRRWLAAAALARPAAAGGLVVVAADLGLGPVQALVRWDPALFVGREAEERAALGFPPASRIAAVDGTPGALNDLLAAASLPAGSEVLGPVPAPVTGRAAGGGARRSGGGARAAPEEPAVGGEHELGEEPERLIIRVRREQGADLARALRAARGTLDARRAGRVRVQLDPLMIG